MRDEEIIALYFDRNEQAIQATMDTYGSYCRKIAGNILENAADVDEVLSDTWLRTWNAIPPQRPRYLRLFLGTITRNLALSVYRAQVAQRRGGGEMPLALEELSECIGQGADPEATVEAKELGKLISAFLRSEPQNSRVIFLRRYYYLESSKQIAQRLGTSESNVRLQLSRTRKKLKAYLNKEGYSV